MIISKEIFKKAIESINEIDKYCDALQNLKIDFSFVRHLFFKLISGVGLQASAMLSIHRFQN